MDSSDDLARFPVIVQFRASKEIAAAIESAATNHAMTRSQYVRSSVVSHLKADGFALIDNESRVSQPVNIRQKLVSRHG